MSWVERQSIDTKFRFVYSACHHVLIAPWVFLRGFLRLAGYRAVCVSPGTDQQKPAHFPMHDLDNLIAALNAQTDAINRLVESNAALMSILLEQGSDDEDAPQTHYLDGTLR
jgi:hypothetical protein